MNLLVDDVRDHPNAHVIARTYDAAIMLLHARKWDVLYLDYDLGEMSYGKSGYGIMQWLEENPEHKPYRIEFVGLSVKTMPADMYTIKNRLYPTGPTGANEQRL